MGLLWASEQMTGRKAGFSAACGHVPRQRPLSCALLLGHLVLRGSSALSQLCHLSWCSVEARGGPVAPRWLEGHPVTLLGED